MSVTSRFGYKHWPCMETCWEEVSIPFLLITREPFGYLQSLYRKPWHVPEELKNISFSEFIRNEWWNVYNEECRVFPGDNRYLMERMEERDPISGRRFSNVCRMRSSKLSILRSVIQRAESPVLHIDFAQIVRNQYSCVAQMAELFRRDLPRSVELVHDYKGEGGWKRRVFNKLTRGRFSRKTRARSVDITEEDRVWIVSNLDRQLENEFGYLTDD